MLLLKKLEIEETKTTKYSTLKTDVLKVGLVFSISNFFINKIYGWGFSISCSNSALQQHRKMSLNGLPYSVGAKVIFKRNPLYTIITKTSFFFQRYCVCILKGSVGVPIRVPRLTHTLASPYLALICHNISCQTYTRHVAQIQDQASTIWQL